MCIQTRLIEINLLKYVKKFCTIGKVYIHLLPDANEHRSTLNDQLKAKWMRWKDMGLTPDTKKKECVIGWHVSSSRSPVGEAKSSTPPPRVLISGLGETRWLTTNRTQVFNLSKCWRQNQRCSWVYETEKHQNLHLCANTLNIVLWG